MQLLSITLPTSPSNLASIGHLTSNLQFLKNRLKFARKLVANDWITPIKPMPSRDRKITVSHPKTKALPFEFSSDKRLSGGETKEKTISISCNGCKVFLSFCRKGDDTKRSSGDFTSPDSLDV